MKNSILGKARWLREVALATSKNNGARVAREWLKYAAMFVMLFTIGIGNVWGADETLTITGASSGHNAPWTTSYGSKTGSSKTSASNNIGLSWTNVGRMSTGIQIKAGTSNNFYSTSYPSTNNIIKSIKITMKTNTANLYGSTDGQNWTSITYTSGSAKDVSASKYKYFKVTATSKYCVLSSISVVYTEGTTPSLTPTPTSLDWGNVLQSSSQSTKTFDISGSNLTRNLSVVVTGGYSVSCGSSISVTSGTPNVTTIAVTPPSTSTTGEKNGKVTISGGGLASDVEIDLSMTVNAAYAVHYYVNGSEITELKELVASGGKVSSLPDAESCDAVNYPYFVGWSTTNFGSTTSAPSLVTGNETISSETTYYAVFAAGTGGNSSTSTIDFEGESSTYSDWKFTNLKSQQTGTITAKGGTYYGTTGDATASVTTKNKIASPTSLTAYVSKQTKNTTSSTWYIRVSSDGSSWTNVKSQSATSMDKGVWVEMTADLTAYSDVYVQVYYKGSTAVRNIDDLTLSSGTPPTYTEWITKCCESWTPPTLSYSVPGNWKAGDNDINATLGRRNDTWFSNVDFQ